MIFWALIWCWYCFARERKNPLEISQNDISMHFATWRNLEGPIVWLAKGQAFSFLWKTYGNSELKVAIVVIVFLFFFPFCPSFSPGISPLCVFEEKKQKECVDKFIDYLYLSFSIHMQTSTSLNEVCNSPSAIFHSNCVLIFIK